MIYLACVTFKFAFTKQHLELYYIMPNENLPLFSVIIPLYNKEAEIGSTIKSVLEQTFPNFELIVVNDGSTDNSLNVLKQFDDARIKIINKPNFGVSTARNTGIFAAEGLYVALLDADDIWLPEYLQEIKQLIGKFDDCNVFGTNYTISSIKTENHNNKPIKHSIINNYFELAMYMPFLTASSIVIKRACFDSEMKFNQNFTHGEDLDLWLRLYKKYKNIGYSSWQLVHYNHSANSRACKTIPQPKKHFAYYFNFKKSENTIEKQYYLYQISMLAWLYVKNLKINYLFDILLKYKRFTVQILFIIFNMILFNKYKRAIKTK